jgi:hypothetical protein
MVLTILPRLVLLLAIQLVLWFLPSKLTRALVYVPSVFLLAVADVPFGLKLGLGLAVAHGVIHHASPFIDNAGYNRRHSAFYDVICHGIMLVYAHVYFSPKLTMGRPLITLVTFAMIVGSVMNCVLAFVRDRRKSDALERWFVLTSITQAYSSGYIILATLFFDAAPSATITLVWAAFIAVYLGNWLYFKEIDRRDPRVLASFFRRGYFEFAFIVPACLGTVYTMFP